MVSLCGAGLVEDGVGGQGLFTVNIVLSGDPASLVTLVPGLS